MDSQEKERYIEREFPMSDKDYALIQKVAYELTGINLSAHKKNMIYGRLARRLRRLGLSCFEQYCGLLDQSDHEEHTEFINAITTNLTAFFRESHHFDFLRDNVFPELVKCHDRDRRVRCWSAGCSSGEEPYSIAILMRECLPATNWNIKLLATDLDSNVVDHAKAGIYSKDRIDQVDESRQKSWFLKTSAGSQVRVKPSIQELITFKQLNLLNSWPMKGPFDVIFCRNVVIYFDKPTQRALFDRFADILSPNGYLFIGHSESLHKVTDRFKPMGRTIYQRVC